MTGSAFFSQEGFVLKREKSAARVDFTGGMGYTLFVYMFVYMPAKRFKRGGNRALPVFRRACYKTSLQIRRFSTAGKEREI